jgi:hypothetical protein
VGKSKAKAPETVLDVGVKFGKVSIGDETASLPAQMDRERMNLLAADELFTGKRLVGRIVVGGEDSTPGQTQLDFGDSVDGAFDVKKMQVSRKNISINLAFAIASIDVSALAHFAKKGGRLMVSEVQDIPAEVEESKPSETRSFLSEGPWREVQLETMFDGSLLQSLVESGIETVGQLSDYSSGNKRLTDIAGIGPGKAQKIEDAILKFWQDNPQYAESKA